MGRRHHVKWLEHDRDAIVCNNMVYYGYKVSNKLYAYHVPSSTWSTVPECPNEGIATTVIDGLLTAVGSFRGSKCTNKLLSLTGEGSDRRWTEKLPPMLCKCFVVSALCAGTILIVAGGYSDRR